MKAILHSDPHPGSDRLRTTIDVNFEVAIAFSVAGIAVFPTAFSGPRCKMPLTRNGHHDAATDRGQIHRWWARWPGALVGVPTGAQSGVWILDVDGEVGRRGLTELMGRFGVKTIAELSPCVSRTPSGGLHLIFRLQEGERPRNRARDIGAGLDTRGVKADGTSAGYFIGPGSALPDGRRYKLVDASTLEPIETPAHPFENAASAPRKLLGLATFNATERAAIAASSELRGAIRRSEPEEWSAIVEQHRAAQREAPAVICDQRKHQHVGMSLQERQYRYAAAILNRELRALTDMRPGTGRNDAAFRLVCRIGRWVHHGVVPKDRLSADVLKACECNGLVRDHGRTAVLATIASGLSASVGDSLPDLEAHHA